MQLDPTSQQGLHPSGYPPPGTFQDRHEARRMARYLSAISTLTRGLGIVGVLGSVLGLLAALGQNRSSDRLGFSLIALGVLLIAVVVWATGVFHGTIARSVPLLTRIDERLEALEARAAAAAARPAPAVPAAPVVEGEVAAVAAPTPAPTAPAPTAPAPTAPAPIPTERGPESSKPEAPAPVQATPVTSEPQDPPRTPCPHCGGLIHPEATRCVHCMKRVARD